MLNYQNISNSWRDLGNLDEKKVCFQDSIIPDVKRDNDSILKSGYWLDIDGELYYFKTRTTNFFLNELLGEKISEYFDLDTVHYELAKGYIIRNNKKEMHYGLLSKWCRKENATYQKMSQFLKENNISKLKGLEILEQLKILCPNDSIVSQMKRFLVREYFTNDWDRLENEILIEKEQDTYSLGYLCDYEYEFTVPLKKIYVPNLYELSFNNYITKDRILEDEEFLEYFKKALLIDCKNMLKEIKEEKSIYITEKEYNWYQGFEDQIKFAIERKLSL